jgi:IclR family transcriptional regulator, carbohydrate utilization repressor
MVRIVAGVCPPLERQIHHANKIIPPIAMPSHISKWDVMEGNPMNDPKTQSTSIQVMSRMFALLDILSQGREAVSLKYISAQTGLHPSTAHRILNDLAAGRYVERSGPGSYRLGLRLLELGNMVRSRLDLREESTRPMLELHRLLGLSVSLYTRQDGEAVCLARSVQERHGASLQRISNGRVGLTDALPGRCMLVKDSAAQVQLLCQQQGHRPEAVALDLQQLRQTGLLRGHDDALAGGAPCVSAPIYNDAGQAIGALSVVGSSAHDTGPAVLDATTRISVAMGWVSDQPQTA